MTAQPTLIATDIDFEREGVQRSVLRVPYSHDRSAYGFIPVPIFVAKRGTGPTMLLTGGVHGDEYEGPLALASLIRAFDWNRLRGRLIVIPALNFPAYLAGTRTSPIDRVNLNRTFPGRRDGTPTEMLAHYVESVLLSLAEYSLDLHAGGGTLNYLPALFAWPEADPRKRAEQEKLIAAFAPPLLVEMHLLGEDRTFDAAARRHQVTFFTGEFGGAATVNRAGLSMLKSGLGAMLDAVGIYSTAQLQKDPCRTRRLIVRGSQHYIFAQRPGIFEPLFHLGDEVEAGVVAGLIHDPLEPWSEPAEVTFERGGTAICIRTHALVVAGDCLGHLAEPVDLAS
jgi:predicted deacylase